VLAVAFTAAPADAMRPVPEGGGGKPAVNMEQVLKAAQLDPHRGGGTGTKGSKDDVVRIQRRLHRKKLLSKSSPNDGVFGNQTKGAYAAWQRRLGYSGLDATGLPGPTSLKKLLGTRYVLYRAVSAGRRATYDGHTVDARTRRMMLAASHRLGRTCVLGVTQGSYNAGGVGASGGTHDGGGAVDLDLGQRCGRRIRTVVKSLRLVGFAAWFRPKIEGLWNAHVHAIAISDPDLAPAAVDQVWDYFIHRDGLKSHAPDTGPRVGWVTWEAYRRAH